MMMLDHTTFASYGDFTNYCVTQRIVTTRAQRTAALRHFFRMRSRL